MLYDTNLENPNLRILDPISPIFLLIYNIATPRRRFNAASAHQYSKSLRMVPKIARSAPPMRAIQTALRRLVLGLLVCAGGIPNHVAFVMDGNRRFAEQEHMEKLDGHEHGYSKVCPLCTHSSPLHRHSLTSRPHHAQIVFAG